MKKFPSIVRTARYNKFNFDPRYYDPIKEEIDEKLKAAKRASKNPDSAKQTSNISVAFQRRARSNHRSNIMQFVIAILLLSTFIGWLFYGNDVFYAFLILSPAYFYFRLKKKPVKE